MGTWEDELDLDLSDIWAAGSKPVQIGTQQNPPEEEKDDDLAFPSQAPTQLAIQSENAVLGFQPEKRVLGLEGENGVTRLHSENVVTPVQLAIQSENAVLEFEPEKRVLGLEDENGVTRLQSENVVLNADVANAPTQVASLYAEPYVSRGGGATVPLATQHLQIDSRQRLPPLPSFRPVIPREVPLSTPNLEQLQAPVLRNPNLREKAPVVDIRKYFTHRGSSSEAGEGASRKKPRIPGPVGELFRKDQAYEGDVVDGDGNAAFGSGEDDFNDRIFRKGAWIRALHSLNVEEFDPARYTILKVTASSIGTSRAQKVPHFVAVIKELTPNVFGDAAVILKDPTGTVAGMMNNKVFSNTDYARTISPGAVIVLKQVAVFSPSAHYLNITISNVVQVFPANTDLPQGSAPAQQQESIPPQSRSQPRSKPQPQPQPQPSPPQQEQPLQPRPQTPSQPLPSSPQQGLEPPVPQSQPRPASPPTEDPKAPDGVRMANWDLLSPSPSPSPPHEEPKAPEGVAAAAKMAGWGDLTDDMEALLNEDVDDFYA